MPKFCYYMSDVLVNGAKTTKDLEAIFDSKL